MSTLPQITLTEHEATFFSLLVDCSKWIDENYQTILEQIISEEGDVLGEQMRAGLKGNLELRVAGGWVRDKLLGKESDDIDITIAPEPFTGLGFAMFFEKYLDQIGKREIMGKLTKIEAKPEQSKHLETATAIVAGLSIDFVQQRGMEVYTEDSRIPTCSFGTPLQDAERRDLTINALFFNLKDQKVEDPTNHGIADLGFQPPAPKTIRTPLEPVMTFKDDPLRVLRAIRFAARFGKEYSIDQSLIEAVGKEEIREALKDPKKISRERVGIELEKMLLGQNPCYAISLIHELDLYNLLFTFDSSTIIRQPTTPPNESESLFAARLIENLIRPNKLSDEADRLSFVSTLPQLHSLLSLSMIPQSTELTGITQIHPATHKRLLLCSLLLPFCDVILAEKKNKTVWAGEKIVMEGIKWSLADKNFASRARIAAQMTQELLNELSTIDIRRDEETLSKYRGKIGMLLRNQNMHETATFHTTWNVSIFWSLVSELVRSTPEQYASIVSKYNAFLQLIVDLELDTKAFEAPLLDGKEINALVPFTKGSPAMAQILPLIMEYQLTNPTFPKEDISNWLVSGPGNIIAHQLVANMRAELAKAKEAKPKKGKKAIS